MRDREWAIVAVAALFLLGVQVQYALALQTGDMRGFLKFCLFAALAAGIFFLSLRLPDLPDAVWYGGTVIALLLTLGTLTVREGRDVERAIRLGFLSLQPLEVLKPFYAAALGRLWSERPLWALGLTVVSALAAFLQPDWDAAVFLVLLSAFIWYFSAGQSAARWVRWLGWGSAVLVGGLMILVALRWGARHAVAQFPQEEARWIQASLASGGWLGAGWNGLQWATRVKNVATDFVVVSLGEATGLLGLVGLLFLYALLLTVTWLRAYGELPPERAAALGIWLVLAYPVVMHLAVALRLSPLVTGVPLPFLSRGGTALLMNAAEAGYLLRKR